MRNLDELQGWQGRDLVDASADKIGTIDDLYIDGETREPEWLVVTTGFLGMRSSFVPYAGATERGNAISVPYTKDQVKDAPGAEADGELSDDEEMQLYSHYGISRSERRSATGLPGEHSEFAAGERMGYRAERDYDYREREGYERDDAMTRSEEEMRVQKVRRPTHHVRLKKYIVTEPVQTTIPVEREEVRLEREPITEANIDEAMEGPDLTESEHEITLSAEEPVVEKRVVPKERVRLDKDVTEEERTISEELRKEQIEIEGEDRKKAA